MMVWPASFEGPAWSADRGLRKGTRKQGTTAGQPIEIRRGNVRGGFPARPAVAGRW